MIPSRRANHMFMPDRVCTRKDFEASAAYFKERSFLIWAWGLDVRAVPYDRFFDQNNRHRLLDGTCFSYDLVDKPLPKADTSIEMALISSEDELNWWYRGQDICFNWDEPAMYQYARALFTKGQLLLAHKNKDILGQAMLYLGKEVAGNYYGSVLPAHRHKGVATAMALARMKMARDQGYSVIVAQCLDSSAGLYRRLGFQKTGVFTLFTDRENQ